MSFFLAFMLVASGSSEQVPEQASELSPSVGESATAGAVSAPEPEGVKSVKCRGVTEVGSRIPVRICRTQAEWAIIERENAQRLQDEKRGAGRKTVSGDIIRN